MTTPLDHPPADPSPAAPLPADLARADPPAVSPAGPVLAGASLAGSSSADLARAESPAASVEGGVGGRLGRLLEPALAGEPAVGDAVAVVFRQADRLGRRRSRLVVAAGAVVVALMVTAGYGLTALMLPTAGKHRTTMPGGAEVQAPDGVRAVFAPALRASGMRIRPHEPSRGVGWRRYPVLAARGRPHGLIEVSVYETPGGLCFPVLSRPGACARPARASATVEYARYAFDRDVNWQVNQAIARRLPDGRTVVVQTTGERGTGSVAGGRPPLTALLTAKFAADPRVLAAFGAREACHGPDAGCPVLKVPLPAAR